MKKLIMGVFCGAAILLSVAAQAAVVNSANVGSLTTFQDTNTGRVWLDMNNFFDATATYGTTGFNMIATATANGFTIANSTDLHQLLDSLPLTGGQWSSYASIMGYGQPRSLIWGMYDNGSNGNNAYYPWAWASNSDPQWNFNGSTYAGSVQNSGYRGAVDMGIWAYQTGAVAAIPEPETYAMLLAGLGLLGFTARRRNGVSRQAA